MSILSRFTSRFSGSGSLLWSATSDDSACPTSRQLYQLSALTFKSSASKDIFILLEKRLRSGPRHWRNISKALTVCKYLILHGSPAVLIWMSAHIGLFTQIEQAPRSGGRAHLATQAAQLVELIQNPEKRQVEKAAYDKTREQVRTSIGRTSLSRNTLELMRDLDELEQDTHEPPPRQSLSLTSGLVPIQEEQ